MRLAGRVFKAGRHWAIEVPMLGVVTQGRSKKDAFLMVADAVESLVNRADFRLDVFPGAGEYFEVGSNDEAVLTALLAAVAPQKDFVLGESRAYSRPIRLDRVNG